MNREQAWKALDEFYKWYADDNADYDPDTEGKHLKNMRDVMSYLLSVYSLADCLGWEEGQVYETNDKKRYKVIDKRILYENQDGDFIDIKKESFTLELFEKLQYATRYEPYYLLYLPFVKQGENYLIYDTENDICDIDDYKNYLSDNNYQIVFKDTDIKKLSTKFNINFDSFVKIVVEVQEEDEDHKEDKKDDSDLDTSKIDPPVPSNNDEHKEEHNEDTNPEPEKEDKKDEHNDNNSDLDTGKLNPDDLDTGKMEI
nr:MAG TPA: hypothetical protein [Caudoviricetes sp.]